MKYTEKMQELAAYVRKREAGKLQTDHQEASSALLALLRDLRR